MGRMSVVLIDSSNQRDKRQPPAGADLAALVVVPKRRVGADLAALVSYNPNL
jgi:hypothetical protein